MRKKQHKKIDGKNRAYDKFYLINYLEPGKTWEDVQAEDDRDILPPPSVDRSGGKDETLTYMNTLIIWTGVWAANWVKGYHVANVDVLDLH